MILQRKTQLKKWLEATQTKQCDLAKRVGCTTAFLNSLINRKNHNIRIGLLHNLSLETKIPEPELIADLLFGDPAEGYLYFNPKRCVSTRHILNNKELKRTDSIEDGGDYD